MRTHTIAIEPGFSALYRTSSEQVTAIEVTATFDLTDPRSLATTAERVWDTVLRTCTSLSAVPLRAWNSMPHINAHTDPDGHGPDRDREPYRRFNLGRARTWSRWDPTGESICAATGIGDDAHPPRLAVAVLATQHPVVHLDNPRQTAFADYDPTRFGTPPSSRRATLHLPPWGAELWLAGTASITGQDNRHTGTTNPHTADLNDTAPNGVALGRHGSSTGSADAVETDDPAEQAYRRRSPGRWRKIRPAAD